MILSKYSLTTSITSIDWMGSPIGSTLIISLKLSVVLNTLSTNESSVRRITSGRLVAVIATSIFSLSFSFPFWVCMPWSITPFSHDNKQSVIVEIFMFNFPVFVIFKKLVYGPQDTFPTLLANNPKRYRIMECDKFSGSVPGK